MDPLPIARPSKPVELAVFDFDRTCIAGNSPVLLVHHLHDHRMLTWLVIIKIMLWGGAYKSRLPQNESWVRGLVFTAFKGMPKEEADQFLYTFYDERIKDLFCHEAEIAMRAHIAEGRVVILISATFEPIVIRAMDFHPIDHQISTRMCVDENGAYTCEVEGRPVEGREKVFAIQRFADAEYGEGSWELAYAYGDHHSDSFLLAASRCAYAVNPDLPLKRIAKKAGWDILKWT